MLFDGVEVGPGSIDADQIAEALLPAGCSDDVCWAIHEGLPGFGEPPPREELLEEVRGAIAAEVTGTSPGDLAPLPLTRALCSRALQFEILADELPRLLAEAGKDAAKGAGTPVPAIDGDTPAEQIRSLRELAPLPELLGRDSAAEGTSDLALRTTSRAAFVGLSAVRAMQRPLGRTLGLVRPLLYGLAGVVSPSRRIQAAVVVGYFAAAAFLAARGLEIEANADIDPSELVAKWNLVAYVCVLFVAGLAAPPLIRLGARVQRIPNALLAMLIVLSAGVLAAVPNNGPLELIAGDLGIRWLFAPIEPGTDQILPEWLMFAILLVTVGVVVGSWPEGKLLGKLKAPLSGLFERSWAGLPTMLGLLAVALGSLIFTVPVLWAELTDPSESWRFGVAIAPFAGVAVVAVLLLLTAGPGETEHGAVTPAAPIELAGMQFTRIEYSAYNDMLRLYTPGHRFDAIVLWTSAEGDRVLGTPAKGATCLEIARARERAEGGETFMTVEVLEGEPLTAAEVLRAVGAS